MCPLVEDLQAQQVHRDKQNSQARRRSTTAPLALPTRWLQRRHGLAHGGGRQPACRQDAMDGAPGRQSLRLAWERGHGRPRDANVSPPPRPPAGSCGREGVQKAPLQLTPGVMDAPPTSSASRRSAAGRSTPQESNSHTASSCGVGSWASAFELLAVLYPADVASKPHAATAAPRQQASGSACFCSAHGPGGQRYSPAS